ncbi:secretion activating protein [Sinorhizobium meliloti]|uniref:secretion activating protein n=1 Tax=Rhizobium meliloti TaxID=382 RepID=UPI001F2A8304|nr:secretion activating protein [Sinorhizobium meliloti]
MIGNALRLAADASGQTVEKPQTPPESGAKADSSDTGIGEVLKTPEAWGPIGSISHCRWRDHGRERSSSEGARRIMVASAAVGLWYFLRRVREAG